jgi:hypothetical protein
MGLYCSREEGWLGRPGEREVFDPKTSEFRLRRLTKRAAIIWRFCC